MSEPAVIDFESLSQLDDQQWRRLGITQTFDRLLVAAVALTPGAIAKVRDSVGRKLSGGAARFWDLSFPQLLRDLKRRNFLTVEREDDGGEVTLEPQFRDRLSRLLNDIQNSVSHVDQTPGVTLDELLKNQQERQEREEAAKAAKKSAKKPRAEKDDTPKPKKTSSKKSSDATPMSRKKAEKPAEPVVMTSISAPAAPVTEFPVDDPTLVPRIQKARRLPAAPASAKHAQPSIFTTNRMQTLFDKLDAAQGAQLLRSQLAQHLSLDGEDLDLFLTVCEKCEITRKVDEDLYELHFQGRKCAQTKDTERRMMLRDLVAKLKSVAEQLSGENNA